MVNRQFVRSEYFSSCKQTICVIFAIKLDCFSNNELDLVTYNLRVLEKVHVLFVVIKFCTKLTSLYFSIGCICLFLLP